MIGYRSLSLLSRSLNYAFFMDQKWSLEHVVPRSYMKHSYRFKDLIRDGHNIILYPHKLNSHRNNYMIVGDDDIDKKSPDTVALDLYGNPIYCRKRLIEEEWHGRLSWKNNSQRIFVPAWPYRGEIARACQYMDNTYVELSDTGSVFPKTMDPLLAHNWIKMYPETEWELNKLILINKLQKLNMIEKIDPEGRQ